MSEVWSALAGASELWAALVGATFAGVFGLAVSWYTNRKADKRAKDDRDERTLVREEQREEDAKKRIREDGLAAIRDVLTAASLVSALAYFHKTEGLDVVKHMAQLESANWRVGAYFPGTVFEMSDMVRIAARDHLLNVSGAESFDVNTTEPIRDAMRDLVAAVHVELGHEFALNDQDDAPNV